MVVNPSVITHSSSSLAPQNIPTTPLPYPQGGTMQLTQKLEIMQNLKVKTKKSFTSVPVGTVFHMNGTLWEKRSTRTAHVFGMPHRWFYFSQNDMVQ